MNENSLLGKIRKEWRHDPIEVLEPGDVSVAFAVFSLRSFRTDWEAQKLSNVAADYWTSKELIQLDEKFKQQHLDNCVTLACYRARWINDFDDLPAQFVVRSISGFLAEKKRKIEAEALEFYLTCGRTSIDDVLSHPDQALEKVSLQKEFTAVDFLCLTTFPYTHLQAQYSLADQMTLWYRDRF